jgi:cytochrome c biogenesis factor
VVSHIQAQPQQQNATAIHNLYQQQAQYPMNASASVGQASINFQNYGQSQPVNQQAQHAAVYAQQQSQAYPTAQQQMQAYSGIQAQSTVQQAQMYPGIQGPATSSQPQQQVHHILVFKASLLLSNLNNTSRLIHMHKLKVQEMLQLQRPM